MKIWLDDLRPAPDGWTWCKTYFDAIAYLIADFDGTIEWVSLDNDLGEGQRMGREILDTVEEWVANNPGYEPPQFMIHSANPVEVERMRKIVTRIRAKVAERKAREITYPATRQNFIENEKKFWKSIGRAV